MVYPQSTKNAQKGNKMVVYFDKLLGACSTWKLAKILFLPYLYLFLLLKTFFSCLNVKFELVVGRSHRRTYNFVDASDRHQRNPPLFWETSLGNPYSWRVDSYLLNTSFTTFFFFTLKIVKMLFWLQQLTKCWSKYTICTTLEAYFPIADPTPSWLPVNAHETLPNIVFFKQCMFP